MFLTVTLNLTKIGNLMRKHPEIVINKKNGEKLVTVAVKSRKKPDQYGNSLFVTLRPKDKNVPLEDENYVGEGKVIDAEMPVMEAPQDVTVAQAMSQASSPQQGDNLPF